MRLEDQNKQIEEMEKISAMDCDEIKRALGIKNCIDLDCHDCIARLFYAKGYRKTTDVAEEIFAEIDKLAKEGGVIWTNYASAVLAELKKKYLEERNK